MEGQRRRGEDDGRAEEERVGGRIRDRSDHKT